jgi:hypothetical protein
MKIREENPRECIQLLELICDFRRSQEKKKECLITKGTGRNDFGVMNLFFILT